MNELTDEGYEKRPEDLDREHEELFHELRSIIPGVQVLIAFLLTVVFTARFDSLTELQRDVYFATFLLATATLVLLLAPTAFHRARFRQLDKEVMIRAANVETVAALVLLSLAMACVVLLITDMMFHTALAWTLSVGMWVVTTALWWAFPLARRHADGKGSPSPLATWRTASGGRRGGSTEPTG